MSFTAKGILHKKFDTEQKSGTFSTREFIVKIEGNKPEHPELIKFQMVQDRCELIDNIREGTKVEVAFDLKGREWQGKYFTNLQAWKCVPDGPAPEPMPSQHEQQQPDDDLLF